MVRPKKSTENQLTYEAPDSLLGKWFLLGAIIRDERARHIHAKVAWPILEAYYSKYGNGRASVRYLEKASGLTKGSVATATADLVAWGYFTRVMGAGKLATSYAPNWELAGVLRSQDVLQPQDAMSVPQSQDASVLQSPDAKSDSAPQPQDESLLHVPPTGGDKEEGDDADAAGGLAAPDAAASLPKRWTITGADLAKDDDGNPDFVELEFEAEDGSVVTDHFYFDPLKSFEPDSRWDDLIKYAETLGEIGDTSDLVGVRVWAFRSDDDLTFIGEFEAHLARSRATATGKPSIGAIVPPGDKPWRVKAA